MKVNQTTRDLDTTGASNSIRSLSSSSSREGEKGGIVIPCLTIAPNIPLDGLHHPASTGVGDQHPSSTVECVFSPPTTPMKKNENENENKKKRGKRKKKPSTRLMCGTNKTTKSPFVAARSKAGPEVLVYWPATTAFRVSDVRGRHRQAKASLPSAPVSQRSTMVVAPPPHLAEKIFFSVRACVRVRVCVCAASRGAPRNVAKKKDKKKRKRDEKKKGMRPFGSVGGDMDGVALCRMRRTLFSFPSTFRRGGNLLARPASLNKGKRKNKIDKRTRETLMP